MNDGGPAFASVIVTSSGRGFKAIHEIDGLPGMSLRDWFAGQALASLGRVFFDQGFLKDKDGKNDGLEYFEEIIDVARSAYEMADAMIKQRSK